MLSEAEGLRMTFLESLDHGIPFTDINKEKMLFQDAIDILMLIGSNSNKKIRQHRFVTCGYANKRIRRRRFAA